MDEGEGGESKNDNWREFQRKNRKRGRVSMESEKEGEERERNSKDSKKQRRENVGKGDEKEGMDDYEWRNKGK